MIRIWHIGEWKMKLVSVIIPTHKGSRFVAEAIKSVIDQTYQNLEIIVVDDNGKGTEEQVKTEQVVKPFVENNRVKYIAHEKNRNGSAARNTGVKNSKGEYICLLDDDDAYYPDKVEKEVEALDRLGEDWGMVFCAIEGSRKGKSGHILFDVLLHSVVIGSNSFMIRRSLWEQLHGFDESFRRHQDFEFTARVASVSKIKYLPFVGFYSKDTFRNNSKNIEQAQAFRTHYLNKMMPLIRTFPTFRQKIIICSNSMEVTSKGSLGKINMLLQYASQWDPKFGKFTVIYVSAMKAVRKLKWRLVKIKR